MKKKDELKMEKRDSRFSANKKAVSPVIGVILMVAITVILAAVIGAFAFGIAPPELVLVPSASLSIGGDVMSGGNTFTVTHNGGDTIVKALVTEGDDYIDTEDWYNMEVRINRQVVGANVHGGHVADLVDIPDEYNGRELPANTVINFKLGDVLKFELDDRPTFSSGDVITVIHVPSRVVLLTYTVP